MTTIRCVFVGGFLGAGKTTLLWEAARRLIARGRRVGLVTNDQAPDLVDTSLLAGQGLDVREVAGSCFCCDFEGLVAAVRALREECRPEIVIAEPVGSCTDLSATILQPLKDRFRAEFALAPLSVLVDPRRLEGLVGRGSDALHPSAAYIVRKQVEEADLLLISKSDTLPAAEIQALAAAALRELPVEDVRTISAATGEGLDAWLDHVLSCDRSGSRIADVDYDVYAEGEAVLGWLNSEVELRAPPGAEPEWRSMCERLLGELGDELARRGAPIGHVKALLSAGSGQCVANLTRLGGAVEVRGEIAGAPADARLVINARVEMDPGQLEALVRGTLERVTAGRCSVEPRRSRGLRPGRPKPTFRYLTVVSPGGK